MVVGVELLGVVVVVGVVVLLVPGFLRPVRLRVEGLGLAVVEGAVVVEGVVPVEGVVVVGVVPVEGACA
ncbi:MAG: hypothetical protein PUP93_10935 [Rhizonema sp. NSF051]|nr:hypothetical protein [Rhizonema sp. NSF051]